VTSYVSKDKHWRVTPISLDGQALLRVETDQPVMPVSVTTGRTGPTQGPGGWWRQADVGDARQVEQWVPFSELTEEITP
jgi:hypothetical protein